MARRPRSLIWARRRRLLAAWARRNGLYRPSLPAGTRRPRSFVWARRGVLAATLLAVAFFPYPVAGSASMPSAGACHGPCRHRRLGREGAVDGRPAGAVDHERRAHRHGPGQRPGLRGARRWHRRRRRRDAGARLRLAHRADAVGRHPDRVPGGRVDRLGPRLARDRDRRRQLRARRRLPRRSDLRQRHRTPDPLVQRGAVRRGGGRLPADHRDRRGHGRHRLRQPDRRRALEQADRTGRAGLAGQRARSVRHRGGRRLPGVRAGDGAAPDRPGQRAGERHPPGGARLPWLARRRGRRCGAVLRGDRRDRLRRRGPG